jgi:hypothetical protein
MKGIEGISGKRMKELLLGLWVNIVPDARELAAYHASLSQGPSRMTCFDNVPIGIGSRLLS